MSTAVAPERRAVKFYATCAHSKAAMLEHPIATEDQTKAYLHYYAPPEIDANALATICDGGTIACPCSVTF